MSIEKPVNMAFVFFLRGVIWRILVRQCWCVHNASWTRESTWQRNPITPLVVKVWPRQPDAAAGFASVHKGGEASQLASPARPNQ